MVKASGFCPVCPPVPAQISAEVYLLHTFSHPQNKTRNKEKQSSIVCLPLYCHFPVTTDWYCQKVLIQSSFIVLSGKVFLISSSPCLVVGFIWRFITWFFSDTGRFKFFSSQLD
ncbi:hypothetical protein GOODEAATRI_010002 [Goodea atripinnis]|uniref:Uncharacterized protein n=1 Tax=Goodea atripinnis TaxID=208336 RepID=A0ABV0PWQ6_9TELE